MPSNTTDLSLTSFRERAFRTAYTGNRDEAKRIVEETAEAFARILTRDDDSGATDRWRQEIAVLAIASVEGQDLALRLAAAERLADAYSALYRAGRTPTGAMTITGRSGPLPVGAKGAGNPGLARLLELWGTGGRVIVPEIEIQLPGGNSRPCVPGSVRVAVEKPGVLPDLSEAGLDPDFVDWLRTQDGLINLLSFAEWRDGGDGSAPTDAERRAYEVALASAYRRYEKERFADRYCRPLALASPGVQYGHRLLRLPLRLAGSDFRDAGCGPQIYEGELGAPLPPELDYEELVRRYVNLLKPEARWRADVNAVTRSDIVESHLRSLPPADPPAVLQFLVVASQTALQHRSMATLIDVADGLLRRGENFSDWMMGPEGAEIRDAVRDAWQRLVSGSTATGGSTVPGALASTTMSAVEFTRALTALCVPAVSPGNSNPPTIVEPRLAGLEPGRFFPVNTAARSPAEVRDQVDLLVRQYDTVWSQAAQLLGPGGLRDARNEIRLSGLEARSHIALLAIACTLSMRYPPYTAGNIRTPIVQELLNWLNAAPVPIRYADIVGSMPTDGHQAVAFGNEQFASKEFWEHTPAPPAQPSSIFPAQPAPPTIRLQDDAYNAIALVTSSYAAAIDAVVSASGAQAAAATGAPAAADPYRIREADLPTLLQRWTRFFAALLNDQRKRREVVGEPLLLLRLVPRRGRYGETPQRTAGEELAKEPKETAWPGHPTRATEGYVLEPLPRRYFMRPAPSVFLREDYRLALMPRGYGIGANLYSMSLLPEEVQTIIVKSSKDTRSKVSESTAENVFEEAGAETSNDFANELARENQQESSNESDFNVAAKASASFLFASAEVSSGYSAKDSARDFAKNTSNVTSKLAQKLSSKRTVSLETKREGEREESTHSEVSTDRKVKNPNLGHTVTFHWFQMTRKFLQELTIEDAKLVYTSGKHNVLRILHAGDELPPEVTELPAWQTGQLQEVASALPPDIARRMPPGAAVVIVGEPYTEAVSMAGANAFLARVFSTTRVVDISGLIWQHFGYFDPAPEGLGVLAYPGNRRSEAGTNGSCRCSIR